MKQLTPVRIDTMAAGDLRRVREIEAQSFAVPWPKDAYRTELEENKVACYLVARDGDAVLGFAGMWVIFDEAHVTTIAVDQQWRGQRVGERLLLALIDRALE